MIKLENIDTNHTDERRKKFNAHNNAVAKLCHALNIPYVGIFKSEIDWLQGYLPSGALIEFSLQGNFDYDEHAILTVFVHDPNDKHRKKCIHLTDLFNTELSKEEIEQAVIDVENGIGLY